MITTSVFKFDFTFENWLPVVDGNVVNYVKGSEGGGIVLAGAATTVTLVTKEPLAVGSVVRNLRDRRGTEIFKVNNVPYDMFVTESSPQFDAFATVVGWRQILRREMPKSTVELLSEMGVQV